MTRELEVKRIMRSPDRLVHAGRTSAVFLVVFAVALVGWACVTNPETGRKSFAPIPDSIMNNLGAQAYAETLQQEKVITSGRTHAVVMRVAQRIQASVGDSVDFDWECNLVESQDVNAFCLPGGKIVVYTGILPVCQNEACLAFVMGHEVGHAVARHGAQRMSKALLIEGGLSLADISFQNNSQHDVIMQSLGLGSQLGQLYYSRDNESEADYMGLRYMARAGYDPSVAPDFWIRMGSLAGEKPPEFLSTHPSDSRRADDINAKMAEAQKFYAAAPQKYGVGERVP
jgi:metalloendopeptidase OMA1, mitochondrial